MIRSLLRWIAGPKEGKREPMSTEEKWSLFGWLYLFMFIFTFGYSSAIYPAESWEPKACDDFRPNNSPTLTGIKGLVAGGLWPLYWSWEVVSLIAPDGQPQHVVKVKA